MEEPLLKPEELFAAMAHALMNMYALHLGSNCYRIAELEFYLHSKTLNHLDTATHTKTNHIEFGHWYVHRVGKGFKGGTRKGIDIALGVPAREIVGGILIRALQNLDNEDDYVYGPSLSVDRMLQDSQLKLADLDQQDAFLLAGASMKPSPLPFEQVYPAPRVNLPKHTPPEFIGAMYRFFTHPRKMHKYKQKEIIPSWIEAGLYSRDEIKVIFGRS